MKDDSELPENESAEPHDQGSAAAAAANPPSDSPPANTGPLSCEVAIINKRGLHARASAKFVGLVAELPDTLTISVAKDGTRAAGGSILGLMMLGAARGDCIEITVEGQDADAALEALVGLVSSGFGED